VLAVLELEFIGENADAYRRLVDQQAKAAGVDLGTKSSCPWVARITGFDATYGLAREFVRGQIDYSRANSKGSRGVYLYFPLKEGVYEVKQHLTWAKNRRYFCRVEGMQITEITRDEVEQWLKKGQSHVSDI
jgi:hypothetical protein